MIFSFYYCGLLYFDIERQTSPEKKKNGTFFLKDDEILYFIIAFC